MLIHGKDLAVLNTQCSLLEEMQDILALIPIQAGYLYPVAQPGS